MTSLPRWPLDALGELRSNHMPIIQEEKIIHSIAKAIPELVIWDKLYVDDRVPHVQTVIITGSGKQAYKLELQCAIDFLILRVLLPSGIMIGISFSGWFDYQRANLRNTRGARTRQFYRERFTCSTDCAMHSSCLYLPT